MKKSNPTLPAKSSGMMSAALTLLLTMTLTGCIAPRHYKTISADREVRRLLTAKPDARWLEIRQALQEKIEVLENSHTNKQ
jgi:hypothetical protein